jgi:DNA-binding MarR family transcriptional regulator
MPRRTEPDPARAAAHQISEQCIAMRVRRLSRTVTRIFDDALRPHGIGTAQLNMLVAITKAGPLRPSALARALDLEKSTVTRNLERMLAHGWIRSTPDAEPNGVRVEVQPAGRALLAQVLPAWKGAQARATRQVGDALAVAVRAVGSGTT